MDWISDQIAIGNFMDAKNPGPDVDAILCLKPDCCDEGREEVEVFCVPLADGSGNPRAAIRNALDYLDGVVEGGDRILVHCNAGRSRSVAIVAAHLMKCQGISRERALALIREKREISLSPGIEEIFSALA